MTLFTVTTLADVVNAGEGVTSLREAIASAASNAGADRIELAAGLGGGGAATINLALGQLVITQAGGPLTIDGDRNDDGVADLTIDARRASRVMSVTGAVGDQAQVTLEGLVITGGKLEADAGVVAGGGITAEDASLTLTDVTVRDNQLIGSGQSDEGFLTQSAEVHGGGLSMVGGSLAANGLVVSGNLATALLLATGGGLDLRGTLAMVADAVVSNNSATAFFVQPGFSDGVGRGGGIAVDDGSLIFSGTVENNGASGGVSSTGGGIAASNAAVVLDHALVRANSANGGGGVAGSVELIDSRVTGNSARSGGGLSGGTLLLTRTTVDGNRASGGAYQVAQGGGIVATTVTLIDSTVSGNTATRNSGLFSSYEGRGGGLYVRNATILNSTVVGNTAEGGYSEWLRPRDGGVGGGLVAVDAMISNSIVGGNRVTNGTGGTIGIGPDIAGQRPDYFPGPTPLTLSSNGHNIFSQPGIVGAQPGDLIVDPETVIGAVVGALADNGGPTPTHAPVAGSVAIDGGATADAPAEPDQRGEPRVAGAAVDVGAVETAGAAPLFTAAADTVDLRGVGLVALPDALTQQALGGDDVVRLSDTQKLGVRFFAGAGDDAVTGGAAADSVDGGAGNDTLAGGAGCDQLLGGYGLDILLGGDGADRLFGQGNADRLEGGSGDDLLNGGFGADALFGGSGADVLIGEAGANALTGGSGFDTFAFLGVVNSFGGATDTVTDFQDGTDRLRFVGFGSDFDSAREILATARQTGLDVTFTLGRTQVIVQDTALADLAASDLLLR